MQSMRSKQSNGFEDEFMEACREEVAVNEGHFSTTNYWVSEADEICGVVPFAALCVEVRLSSLGSVHNMKVKFPLRSTPTIIPAAALPTDSCFAPIDPVSVECEIPA